MKWSHVPWLLGSLLVSACGGGGGGNSPPPNSSPVAEAGQAVTTNPGIAVSLDGTGSRDSDGSITSYLWTQTSGTPVVISRFNQRIASFVAPVSPVEEALTFNLLVRDDDGATANDAVAVTVRATAGNVTGAVQVPAGTVADSDVNDFNAAQVRNDTPGQAQLIPNPVTLGGHINRAGSGPAGATRQDGDESDYYRVSLLKDETITLFVADIAEGDPDLYLWTPDGLTVVDSSLSIGTLESLVVPADGEYLVEAFAFSGASNYILTIGQTQVASAGSGYRLSDDFVAGEGVVEFIEGSARASATGSAATHGFATVAGDSRRAMRVALLPSSQRAAVAGDDRLASRLDKVPPERREKFETLLRLKTLASDPQVEYAHPNYIMKAQAVPNDPLYPSQWHYPMIDLPAAWDLTTGSGAVTVAVIDTGVVLSHPDLAGKTLGGFDFISNPAISNDGDGIDANPNDPGDGTQFRPSSYHGTHVAGTVAASSDNNLGVTGIAWNANIMPLRVLGVGGGTTYDILQAVRYAAGLSNDSGQVASPPVDIMNLSLGGFGPCPAATQAAFSAARTAGVSVVVAAGNDSDNAANYTPANCGGVITVSSVNINRGLAYYSNSGAVIDVAAPGGDTTADFNGDGFPDGVLSTSAVDGNGLLFNYRFFQGTSMAAPHVAGVLALMKSVNSDLTPAQIDQMLVNGELTEPIGSATLFGAGLINARRAVAAALNAGGAPPVDDPMLALSPASLGFGSSFSTASFTLRNSGSGALTVAAPVFTAPWLQVSVPAGGSGLGVYSVAVNRTGLLPGVYSDTVTISSSVNTVELDVAMQVPDSSFVPDVGFLYILLIDEDDNVVAFDTRDSDDELYEFELNNLPAGTYRVLAGTDSDNDQFVCDEGEACGGFRTLFQMDEIEFSDDVSNVVFPVSFVVAIPNQGAALQAPAPPLRARYIGDLLQVTPGPLQER